MKERFEHYASCLMDLSHRPEMTRSFDIGILRKAERRGRSGRTRSSWHLVFYRMVAWLPVARAALCGYGISAVALRPPAWRAMRARSRRYSRCLMVASLRLATTAWFGFGTQKVVPSTRA